MIDPNLTCMRCMGRIEYPGAVCPHCGYDNAHAQNQPHQLPAGSILAGMYLIGCALGQGGFGITYVGWDINLDQKLAIKEYYPDGCVTRELSTHATVMPMMGEKGEAFVQGKQRFVEEARSLARFIKDPCIVGVKSFFQENGTAYIVMDFVEGMTLKKYAEGKGGKLSSAEVLSRMQALIYSLGRIHDGGLLHRDIAPDNIIIQPDGTLKLLDFGAARQMSVQGEHSLTVNVKHGFAPEEQYRTHGEQGPWSDVYALCATIYYLTTGTLPPQSMDRALGGLTLPEPNDLGADFTQAQQAAIMKGLSIDAADRQRDMPELAAALYGTSAYTPPAAASTGAPAYAYTPPSRPAARQGKVPESASWGDRKKWIPILAGAAAAVIIAVLATALITKESKQKEAKAILAEAAAVTQTPAEAAALPAETPTRAPEPTPTPSPEPTIAPTDTPAPTPAMTAQEYYDVGVACLKEGNFSDALSALKQSADGGCVAAYNVLAAMYCMGKGVAANDVEAVKWAQKSADAGDAVGQYWMGLFYAEGIGVGTDLSLAAKYLEASSAQGDPDATCLLADWYFNGYYYVQDLKAAVTLYQRAGNAGSAEAQLKLGDCYEHAYGVQQQSMTQAASWYRLAAENGNADAQETMGRLYRTGNGVNKNYVEAARWYKMAAENGHLFATYRYGEMMYKGLGMKKDVQGSMQYIMTAAQGGVEQAIEAWEKWY